LTDTSQPYAPDEEPQTFVDPEAAHRNEQFAMTVMSLSIAMVLGMIFGMAGLTSAFIADQVKGLTLMGWGMLLFTGSAVLHLVAHRIWLGGYQEGLATRNAYLLAFAFLSVILYLYALLSKTAFVFIGFIGGNFFFPLFGSYLLSLERVPPAPRRNTFNITPFSRISLAAILLAGIIAGMGIGMASSGSQSIGRGLFARRVVADKIDQSRLSIHMVVFQFIKPYRIIESLQNARKRGVEIQLLVRPEAISGNNGDIESLLKAGIPIRILPPDTPKWLRPYTILDGRVLLQGSKGWADLPVPFQKELSVQASLLIFERIRKMDSNFLVLWDHSKPLNPIPSPAGG
jgi:hypothetical protein